MAEPRLPRLSIVCSCKKIKELKLKLTDRTIGIDCSCAVHYTDKEGVATGPLANIKIEEMELLEW